jgi:hypothetical protein
LIAVREDSDMLWSNGIPDHLLRTVAVPGALTGSGGRGDSGASPDP